MSPASGTTAPTHAGRANVPRPAPLVVEALPVQGLAALLGGDEPQIGELLPPLWHWTALARWAESEALGPDGHPRLDQQLAALGKPRRMFAGGEVVWRAPVRVGDLVELHDRVLAVTPKSGRQGDFVLVQTETVLSDEAGEVLLEERRDLIYRDAVSTAATAPDVPTPSPVGQPLLRAPDRWNFEPDPTALLRFSALTCNAHRIHYDWPYATSTEGYPGLVVQGPFMTIALAEALRRDFPEADVRRVQHRNVKPLFCGTPAWIDLVAGHRSVELRLRSEDGVHVEAIAHI